jgi:hypothetical protein
MKPKNHLMLRLRICGALPPHSIYGFMAQGYFTFNIFHILNNSYSGNLNVLSTDSRKMKPQGRVKIKTLFWSEICKFHIYIL